MNADEAFWFPVEWDFPVFDVTCVYVIFSLFVLLELSVVCVSYTVRFFDRLHQTAFDF